VYSTESELRRLRSGPGAEDFRERPFLVRARFAAADPAQVVANVRAVLTCVVEHAGEWPAFERWTRLLPAWFVQRCAPESSGPGDQAVGDDSWTLSSWLYCFDPSEDGMGADRSWWWWSAEADAPHSGYVQVATTGWPFGSGSLRWLIEAGGGGDVTYGA
jgi:hypothetical protein